MNPKYDVVVAGHTCMDMFPGFNAGAERIEDVLMAGKLIEVGPMTQSMGGVVPNTGGALQRLGLTVCPMGKVGQDDLGKSILNNMQANGMNIGGMITDPSTASSYTIVLNIPGLDRIPLHCPGANDSFGIDDIDFQALENVRHFHLGYPPLMRGLFADGGDQLTQIFQKAKQCGVSTSLDMARPDPESDAGRADWRGILEKVLPFVDLFTPSIDELLYMLDRPLFDRFVASDQPLGGISRNDLDKLGSELLLLGAGSALIKLGNQGLYFCSSKKSIYVPCFTVKVAGAIGAGDCTVAGFLAAQLRGLPVEEAIIAAVAVGSCNVEQIDSLSGIPSWEALQSRLSKGWKADPTLF